MTRILAAAFILVSLNHAEYSFADGQDILDDIVDKTKPVYGPVGDSHPQNGIVLTPEGYAVYKDGQKVVIENNGIKPPLTINTAEIIQQTFDAAPECLEYCYIGTCVWLKCHILDGCDITATMLVRHYNPDAVVSAYYEPGANPWTEFRDVLGSLSTTAGQSFLDVATGSNMTMGGGNVSHTSSEDHGAARTNALRSKEVDLIGHPVPSILNNIPGFGILYFCESQATAFRPYYISTLDSFNWRYGIVEMLYPSSWIPGMNEVGSFSVENPLGNTWGSIYPRVGTLVQADDPKASAVFAVRAASIATANAQPHIYTPLTGSTGDKGYKKLPGQANPHKDYWQILLPKQKTAHCERLGQNDSLAATSWSDNRFVTNAGHRDYVFNYWRQYTCCAQPPSGYHFLFHVSFPQICI